MKSSLPYQTSPFIRALANFLFFIFVFAIIFAPPFGFQSIATNTEAEEETEECDSSENAKRQGFTFGLQLGSCCEKRT